MRRDMHNNVKYLRGYSPTSTNTGNTAMVSQIIDTANAGSVEYIGQLGSLADADATFTVLVEDGDTPTLTDNAAVDDAFLLGVEAATITTGASAGDGAAFGFADDNKTFKIGYCGPKRYVRVTVTPAANTGDIYYAAVWALGNTRKYPQSTQVN